MLIRLDKLVSEKFGLSRRVAQEAILNGKVELAGSRCDQPGTMVLPEAVVDYFPNRPKSRRVVNAGFTVLHEDRHVLIVDKPAGLLTVPVETRDADTLVARVERYLNLRHGGKPFVGLIHRIDRDTSGALALAKTPEALVEFKKLWRQHTIERQYLAVVEGSVRQTSGTIDTPLIDDGSVRRSVAYEPGEGVPAITHFKLVERFGPVASLLACWLETGRTHQIRLHLSSIGHPIVGERVYRQHGLKRSKADFRRQALHAQGLGFKHPMTGQDVRVEAPVPADLAGLMTDLRNRYGIPGAGG